MRERQNNIAYIDAANLHKGVQILDWELDYFRFRVWLQEKYSVQRAYIFIGLVPRYKNLYTYLQEAGFTLVFKETVHDGDGHIKGNCDADLVLRAAVDFYENRYDKALLVSSDGDYASLAGFLHEKNRLVGILSPSVKCSILLKRTNARIAYLGDQKNILQKEKTPDMDGTV